MVRNAYIIMFVHSLIGGFDFSFIYMKTMSPMFIFLDKSVSFYTI